MADDYVRKSQFEEFKASLDRRFEDHAKRMEGLHIGAKEIRNAVGPMLFLREKVDDLVKDFKELPTHDDLNYQTQTINTRIDSLQAGLLEKQVQDERRAERRTAANRWLMGLAVTIGLPLALALLKKVGLL